MTAAIANGGEPVEGRVHAILHRRRRLRARCYRGCGSTPAARHRRIRHLARGRRGRRADCCSSGPHRRRGRGGAAGRGSARRARAARGASSASSRAGTSTPRGSPRSSRAAFPTSRAASTRAARHRSRAEAEECRVRPSRPPRFAAGHRGAGVCRRTRPRAARRSEDTIRRALLDPARLDLRRRAEPPHRARLASRGDTRARRCRGFSGGAVFEYWAHEACLIPVDDWPLFGRRRPIHHPWHGDVMARFPGSPSRCSRRSASAARCVARLRRPGRGRMWTGSRRRWCSRRCGLRRARHCGPRSGFQRCTTFPSDSAARGARGAGARRGRAPTASSSFGPFEAGRAHRSGDRGALALAGGTARVRPDDALVARAASSGSRRGWRRRRARPRRHRSRPPRPTPPRSSPPSTTSSGTGLREQGPRLRPPHRGLQARAARPVRLLRPAVPLARSHRRSCRPEVRARRRHPGRERAPSRAWRPSLWGTRGRVRPRARPAPAPSGSSTCVARRAWRSKPRRRGAAGRCEARTQGAPIPEVFGRPRTTHRDDPALPRRHCARSAKSS